MMGRSETKTPKKLNSLDNHSFLEIYSLKYKQMCKVTHNGWYYCNLRKVQESLTKSPHKVVLRPQSQHGQVKVDNLQVEGRGSDEVVVDGAVHWEQPVQRQVCGQGDGTRAQLGHDGTLPGDGRRFSDYQSVRGFMMDET